jgi:hypothetical protein
MMKMYTSYINDYDNANVIWNKYNHKPEFDDYLMVPFFAQPANLPLL